MTSLRSGEGSRGPAAPPILATMLRVTKASRAAVREATALRAEFLAVTSALVEPLRGRFLRGGPISATVLSPPKA